MIHIPRRRPSRSLLDLTPLIDCVFQLLIFFLLTSNLMAPAVRMELPTAQGTDAELPTEVIVTLDGEGTLYLDREIITLDELEDRLRERLVGTEEKAVRFRGDGRATLATFVEILDIVRRAGAEHFDIEHTAPDSHDR